MAPRDRSQFLMDFLPIRTRVVTREGIEIEGLKFSHEELQGEINPAVQRFVRLDPRDISRVYLEGHDGSYLTVPLRSGQAATGMSWWEWKAIRRCRTSRSGEVNGESKPRVTGRAPTRLRASRQNVRKTEWQALQAVQTLPAPDTRLRPVLRSDEESPLPQWEILD
jgi:Mu transposase, C-terminal